MEYRSYQYRVLFRIVVGTLAASFFALTQAEETFAPEAIMPHVQILAGQDLFGRKAGSEFEKRTAEYIAKQLDAADIPTPQGANRLQVFEFAKKQSLNVLGEIKSTGPIDDKVIVLLGII